MTRIADILSLDVPFVVDLVTRMDYHGKRPRYTSS